MNIDNWITGTLNQLFRRGYYTQVKLKKIVTKFYSFDTSFLCSSFYLS